MILTKPQIADLHRGKLTELRYPIDEPPPEEVNGVYAVFTSRGKEPSAWVRIMGFEVWTDPDDQHEEWLLRFAKVPAPDVPRLLMYNGRRPGRTELGYTDIPAYAMRDEPEAVDEKTQKKITKDGWTGFRDRERHRILDRRLLALEERMKLAWGDGQRLRISLSDDMRAIERIVAAMERKTDQSSKAA